MNIRVVAVSSLALLLGGCAWLNEQPYYVPGASYVTPYVESCYTTPTVVVSPGCRPAVVRRPLYRAYRGVEYDHRYRHGDTPRNRSLRILQREAHEEREFIKDAARANMKWHKDAAKMELKMRKDAMKMQQAQAKAKMKMQQAQAKAKMKAAARAKKR